MATTVQNLLTCENLVKSFGQEEHNVLDRVSLSVKNGEFVSVMGPSGSGKSTLMYALSGMDTVNGGTILFDGKDLSKMKDKELADTRRNAMGFVFQQPSLLRNLNILDNIILIAVRSDPKNRKAITKKAIDLMEMAGIASLGQREVSQVSGGQLQRAGICRSLMNNPKILFCDEPTGALNSKTAGEIMDVFGEINKVGTAIVMVTHDAKIASRSERILFMSDGKIVKELKLFGYYGREEESRVDKIMEIMREIGI
ncbi:ABC-type antimicrobial peptide transport system, ATPase component [Sphaerochaeta pleomorpha str. Grapes]|uniref:ABC-type antimicrobial peptide transport system, ATPase component n=1 Tax=Sphaerochaeta pleomorpha (strain ATCC BAA-1885 / DSM 22778 / Grapes) TaxID=158190 RepID=G8QQR0_SPHPG|nr:ABC transporter ATP-binding protein [Sphaerochaeta pleomorpha]AEV28691.1 ABC-type antimicrobial peptide transport system, ATPase component [Sphaerochaeta pleomorpha str. Grapes]